MDTKHGLQSIDVSVVIAAYNAQRTIAEAIRSVLEQSLPRLEVLVCDDASTDDTANSVRSINDKRVKLIINHINRGPGWSRDRLIELAQGQWISFLDADDSMQHDRLNYLVSIARLYPYALIFDDITECHDTSQGMVPFRRVHGKNAFSKKNTNGSAKIVTLSNILSSKRLLIKPIVPLELIREHRVKHLSHRYGEDCAFFWTLIARGVPCYYFPSAMYNYRITPGSANTNPNRHLLMASCLKSILSEPISLDERNVILRRASFFQELADFNHWRTEYGLKKFMLFARYFLKQPQRIPIFAADLINQMLYNVSRILVSGHRR